MTPTSSYSSQPPDLQEVDRLIAQIKEVRHAVGEVIFGQDQVVEDVLVTLLSGGHALLVGLPGLAKTRLAHTLGTVFGLDNKRVQFTPDLMPSDILGSEVLEEGSDGTRRFRFLEGPVFCQLLLADEINRASPRTQSALLQAMQEHNVSVAGQSLPLPSPFHVLATQNPIEQEGTYPLPEAQLDRFLLQINVDYPDEAAERAILATTTGAHDVSPRPVMTARELMVAQQLVRRMPIGDSIIDAILRLVRSGRPQTTSLPEVRDLVSWGPGPRASQALALAVRARALLEGRSAPTHQDVAVLAPAVLRHRMALTFSARADGVSLDTVIDRLIGLLS
ncbi:MoxR family ATPase [Phaeovibrio sulfidiphilus]|uniref:MoxR family ATPase n=1 Tax=Phaeovibrio sulfidiphilus TaxID=1220600 RepID=A0A8J6YNE1_9PROT|nr:MoxR family ATPase [Phaeovibrio sulfidiphilus]MBE1236097.1 MoxR family ATPase [Phaeovibrio sulfidiphilus]